MKKLLALVLLVPSISWAADGSVVLGTGGMVQWAPTVSVPCAAPSADELSEGFDAVGYDDTSAWTEVIQTGGIVDEDATLPGTPPENSCTAGLYTYDADSVSYSRWDNGTTISRSGNIDIVCSLYVDEFTRSANFDVERIVQWDDDTTATDDPLGGGWIELRRNDPDTELRGRATASSSSVTISLDTWMVVKLHLDATAASSYFQCVSGCADSAQKTFTRFDTADGRYMQVGVTNSNSTGDTVGLYFGYCTVATP